ncbi:hypothetical protein [Lactococcus cremoris]|uniref:Uncharacterized protein n=2 Tax=Lactococcus lactis subsp. cremoris TaxID=1359 RepID=A0A1V0PG60_LACLC|nr:hypothetical protein [Lactococcus cremoris]ARE28048.2 hypothetical protein LLJM1_0661 [Lactococcus cremoris]MBU8903341.1 hypothetical protein [Lactococcus cremoris]TNV02101.1 hypothetical protein FIB47_04195 [Lactococcus cremoris]TRW54890.1 hypothetical protein FNJ55_06525 [Lactococcus lactis]
MNWITGITRASNTVTDTADSISSFFGLGDDTASNAISSIQSTTTGNLWNLASDGDKSSTSLGIFFLPLIIAVIVLAYLAFSKRSKGLNTATGIVGIVSSVLFLLFSFGYSGVVDSISESISSSTHGLASTEFNYNLGYMLFILFAFLLLLSSILTLTTRSKYIQKK